MMKGKGDDVKTIDGFTFDPNVIWMLPPKTIDESKPIDLLQALPPRCPDTSIESGELVCFRGENEFLLKIGGTTYEVSTHFSTKGKQSVLEQFKRLILSEKLI